MKTLLASAIGGPLGYLSHPWLLGEKQDELAGHLKSWMKKLQESSRQMRNQPMVATKTLPIRLDADGRDYAAFLQQLRLHTILSAYSSPSYNAACPGAASHSFHLRNMALDLAFDCPPCVVVKAAEALRAKGFFCGGIGRYPGFTHVDTRGQAADWG